MPSVGYVVERYPVLSETFVSNEISELRRQGVAVHVTSLWRGDTEVPDARPDLVVHDSPPRKPRGGAAHLHAFATSPGRYVRAWRTWRRLGAERGEVSFRRLPTVARRLRAADVDRLHAHFAWGGAALAMCLSELTGWPWAMTVHARDIFANPRNLDRKLASADLVITVCDFNQRYLRDTVGFGGRVEKVICGVVPPTESPSDPNLDVVYVGRLVEKKGVDVLLRAVAEVRRDRPDMRLEVYGDGPLRADLERLSDQLGLGGSVCWHGATPHDATLAAIGRASVLAFPGRVARDGDVDSMPLAIKEAMVRRVPVVGCDAGGVREMLDDGCGELVPSDDVAAFARGLLRLLTDQPHRTACVEAAYTRAQADFRLDDQVAKLRRLLQALVRRPPD